MKIKLAVKKSSAITLLLIIIVCSVLIISVKTDSHAIPSDSIKSENKALCKRGEMHANTIVDGISLNVCSKFLPNLKFDTDNPDFSAVSSAWEPFRQLTVKAIPFGMPSEIEISPEVNDLSGAKYKQKLRDFRNSIGGTSEDGPVANIFGREVGSTVSLNKLAVDGLKEKPIIIVEWVTTYKDKTWIVRVAMEQGQDIIKEKTSLSFVKSLTGLTVLEEKSKSVGMSCNTNASVLPTLSAPGWWNPEISNSCNSINYSNKVKSINPELYPNGMQPIVGPSYRGVYACGPGMVWDGTYDSYGNKNYKIPLVNFGEGPSQYEWQCVEYVMRFMKLAYDITPYSVGGGKNVVSRYSGNKFGKVSSGTPNLSPQPGDILSQDPLSASGHTSVVTENHVNLDGTGYIMVIQQNYNGKGAISRINMVSPWRPSNVISWLSPCIPPASGDWVLYDGFDCEIADNRIVGGSVIVPENTTLTIKSTGSLDIDFMNKKLLVEKGTVWVEPGGKIF